MKKILHILLLLVFIASAMPAYAQISPRHRICSTCGKTIDNCRYKGKHPECPTCGKVVDNCQYKGNHPKCSTCGKVVDNCQYKGNHPKCSTCGKVVDNCQYKGNHPKCKTCGKVIDECAYRGKHPAKCRTCGKTVDKCAYKGKHPAEKPKTETTESMGDVFSQLQASMVRVEGGTFKMGATAEQGRSADNNERPVHSVTLKEYYICKYEVTQELWQAVMGNNPSRFKGDSKRPVENVSWQDCMTFIDKLNKMTGKKYRLPTEAEWEYAARGGHSSKSNKYSGGNAADGAMWYEGNAAGSTHPVGAKMPNELGLYDMNGNVWEWCQDRSGCYTSGSQNNPTGPSWGNCRIIRGGCWTNGVLNCRTTNRNAAKSSVANAYIGLRLAM